jgi:hypothetical protein
MAPGWLENSNAQVASPPRTAAEDIHTVYKSPRLITAENSMPEVEKRIVFLPKNHVLTGHLETYGDIRRHARTNSEQKKTTTLDGQMQQAPRVNPYKRTGLKQEIR